MGGGGGGGGVGGGGGIVNLIFRRRCLGQSQVRLNLLINEKADDKLET